MKRVNKLIQNDHVCIVICTTLLLNLQNTMLQVCTIFLFFFYFSNVQRVGQIKSFT